MPDATTLGLEDLRVGERYRIAWDDCCTAGVYTGELTKVTTEPDPLTPDEPDVVQLVFGSLTLTPPFHGVLFTPAGDDHA